MDIRNKVQSENNTDSIVSRMEELENRQLYSATTADIGINVNDNSSAAVAKAVPVLKQMGVTTVRLWASVTYTNHTMTSALQRAIDYKNAGFDVLVIVNPSSKAVPNAADVKGWFQWAAGQSDLKAAVDRWEIGNEVDSSNYFSGTLQQYVTNELAPAYSALHAAGEKVVSAGVSWNPQDIKTMMGYGLTNYCDMIGFHPYANGVSLQATRIKQLEDIVGNAKPLVATEWNIRGYESNKTAWAQAVEDAYTQVRDGFAYNYYFCLFVQNTPAGPGAILNADGTHNTLFWDAFATFQKQNAAAGTVSSGSSTSTSGSSTSGSTTSGSSTSTSGNTASSATGSISGILWNDGDADGVKDSNEAVTGVRTVFIDVNGNGKLDAGERAVSSDANGKFSFTGLKAGSYKISRVFPAGFRMSNGVDNDLSVTLNAGQTITNANIGTTDKAATSSSSSSSSSSFSSSTNVSSTVGSTTSTTTYGTIAGTLWNDSDNDGVFDSNESATGSRTVFIDANGNGKLDSGEKTTTSDAEGNYSFTGLTAGTYKISRVFPDGYRLSNGNNNDLVVSLTAGQLLTNVDLGTTNRAAA